MPYYRQGQGPPVYHPRIRTTLAEIRLWAAVYRPVFRRARQEREKAAREREERA